MATWYGMTREEAEICCGNLGLDAYFTETMDPKAASEREAAGAYRDTYPQPAPAGPSGIYKVIRAKEADGAVTFLLGCFAEEKRTAP